MKIDLPDGAYVATELVDFGNQIELTVYDGNGEPYETTVELNAAQRKQLAAALLEAIG